MKLSHGLILLFVTSLLGCSNKPIAMIEEKANPYLEIEGDRQKTLGPLAPGAFVQERFQVKNISSVDVKLFEDVWTACGCVEANINRTALKPGEIAEVVLRLNVPYSDVLFHREMVAVRTRDPISEPLNMELTYEVSLPYVVKPAAIRLAGVPGQHFRETITFFRNSRVLLELTDVAVGQPWAKASFSGFKQNRGNITVEGTFPEQFGTHKADLVLSIVGGDANQVVVPVELDIHPKIQLLPPEISFMTAAKQSTSKRVIVRGLQNDQRIGKIVSSSPHLIARVDDTVFGNTIVIDLSPSETIETVAKESLAIEIIDKKGRIAETLTLPVSLQVPRT